MGTICHQIITIQREKGEVLFSHPLREMFCVDHIRLARRRSELPGDIVHRRCKRWCKNRLFDLDRLCSVHSITLCMGSKQRTMMVNIGVVKWRLPPLFYPTKRAKYQYFHDQFSRV